MSMREGIIVKGTNAIAAAGVLMPAWLPGLSEISSVVGLLVPILSAIWLTVQIALSIRKHWYDDEK